MQVIVYAEAVPLGATAGGVGVGNVPAEIPVAVGDRGGECQIETGAGSGALAGAGAGAGAPGGHTEGAGLEHLPGGAGLNSPVFYHFRFRIHRERCPNHIRKFSSSPIWSNRLIRG